MKSNLKIAGLCGSLRDASINRHALRTAGSLMPEGMRLEIAEFREVPMFDADVLRQGLPAPVHALREALRHADGVLIATPEYNFSIPGGLKNALDWISRGEDQPLAFKPVAILSAAPGPVGGARMQYDLRKVLLFMNAQVLAKPEVFVTLAEKKFDAQGRCIDEGTREVIAAQMMAFHEWVGMVRAMNG
ncbi:MAG TPA: NADPH-dependent FMN reductase [Ramlibacter sp.]|nr:NADPH-dependent FMN reductase [Ramlibacter sp.]